MLQVMRAGSATKNSQGGCRRANQRRAVVIILSRFRATVVKLETDDSRRVGCSTLDMIG